MYLRYMVSSCLVQCKLIDVVFCCIFCNSCRIVPIFYLISGLLSELSQGQKMHLCTVNKCRHLQWWFVSTRKVPIVEFFGTGGGCHGFDFLAYLSHIDFFLNYVQDWFDIPNILRCVLSDVYSDFRREAWPWWFDISKLPYWSAFTLSGSRPHI